MRERIRSAAFIARTDISFMLRQRETILWVFVMPLLFFYFIGTVTGGFGGNTPDRPDPIALQTPSSGVALDAIVKRLETGNFRVERPATGEALEPFTRRLVLPAFTDESLSAGRRQDPPAGFSQAVPGTMVMFTMLILLTSGAITLVVEREYGLLRRLASTPITAGSIVAGKWTSRMALGLVQIAFAMLVGRLLFKVDWGPSVAMVALVLAAWASFNASFALLLGNIARTQPQMAGAGVLITMVLAALGGCWWPIEITPEWMQSLALALPTGWTMDAMHKLVNFGYGPGAAVPHVAVLAGASVLCGWGGAKIFRYQ